MTDKKIYSPGYNRCVFLRAQINETNNILDLTNRAPGILERLNRGKKFPKDSIDLAKSVGVDLNQDGTPTQYTRVDLQGFITSKRHNLELLKSNQSELDNLINENNFPRQDSSGITGDSEPMDWMDPDG